MENSSKLGYWYPPRPHAITFRRVFKRLNDSKRPSDRNAMNAIVTVDAIVVL